jgi:Na+/H+ antiporter NhaD/arsenite permease-like protein
MCVAICSSPGLNTAILAIGAVLASFMGTTGASMLLIRPLLRANDNRRHQAHVVVFFIFIVSNAGGALTPLGDPPLFLGFLKGWISSGPCAMSGAPCCFSAGAAGRFLCDRPQADGGRVRPICPIHAQHGRDRCPSRLGFDGRVNFVLLAVVVALVLVSGIWRTPVGIEIVGTHVGLPGLCAIWVCLPWFCFRSSSHPPVCIRPMSSAGGPCRKWPSCLPVFS